MKKLFVFLLCAAAIAASLLSCGGNEWDGSHTIDINVRESLAATKADTTDTTAHRLSPKEIVKQTWSMTTTFNDDGVIVNGIRGFSPAQTDTINWKLKMWSTDIIDYKGNLMNSNTDFINAYDVTLINDKYEVIAYVPNAVLEKAREEIIAAYNEGDYETVYELFDQAYTALPITQQEYDELKAKGEE